MGFVKEQLRSSFEVHSGRFADLFSFRLSHTPEVSLKYFQGLQVLEVGLQLVKLPYQSSLAKLLRYTLYRPMKRFEAKPELFSSEQQLGYVRSVQQHLRFSGKIRDSRQACA